MNSYPHYIHDWRGSEAVMFMSNGERGLYRELLDFCWEHGSLPGNEKAVMLVGRCSQESFAVDWPAVSKCFELQDDGRYHNPSVDEKRPSIVQLKEKRKIAGGIGGKIAQAKRSELLKQKPSKNKTLAKAVNAYVDVNADGNTDVYVNAVKQTHTPRAEDPDPTAAIWKAIDECLGIWPKPSNRQYSRDAAEREAVNFPAGVVVWAEALPERARVWSLHYRQAKADDKRVFVPLLDFWIKDGEYARNPPRGHLTEDEEDALLVARMKEKNGAQ